MAFAHGLHSRQLVDPACEPLAVGVERGFVTVRPSVPLDRASAAAQSHLCGLPSTCVGLFVEADVGVVDGHPEVVPEDGLQLGRFGFGCVGLPQLDPVESGVTDPVEPGTGCDCRPTILRDPEPAIGFQRDRGEIDLSSRHVLGAPGESRTPDLLIRSQTLYPAELRAQQRFSVRRLRTGHLSFFREALLSGRPFVRSAHQSLQPAREPRLESLDQSSTHRRRNA